MRHQFSLRLPTVVLLSLVFVLSSCGKASNPGEALSSEATVLAYSDAKEATTATSCEDLVTLLLSNTGLLASEADGELLNVIGGLSTDLASLATETLKYLDPTPPAPSSTIDAESHLVELHRTIDDLSSERCAVPAYSAAAALDGASSLPAELPCFVYRPEANVSAQYVPTDCLSGATVYLHSGGEWQPNPEIDQRSLPTTAPPTTTVKETRPEPVITTTTVPTTTTTPQTTAPSTPSGDDGDGTAEGQPVEETTTTTIAEPLGI